jgi:hypothetical protein
MFFVSICNAGDVKVFRKETYELNLESKMVRAGQSISEIIDLDIVKSKVPDQILSTVKTGEWIYNLPSVIGVSDGGNIDDIEESWDVSFADVKRGGRIVFTRTIKNNGCSDRESYSWAITLNCRFIKYR